MTVDITRRARDAAVRPPAPVPREGALGPLGLYRALRTNAITAWRAEAFEEPYIADRNMLGGFVLLNDPDLIRHVLIDNAANYPKDDAAAREADARGRARPAHRRRRRLAAAAPHGRAAVSAGECRLVSRRRWRPRSRRCWRAGTDARGAAQIVDVAREMTALTYDIISRTVFSPRDRDAARRDGRGDHHLLRCARPDRSVGRAAAAALAAAARLSSARGPR